MRPLKIGSFRTAKLILPAAAAILWPVIDILANNPRGISPLDLPGIGLWLFAQTIIMIIAVFTLRLFLDGLYFRVLIASLLYVVFFMFGNVSDTISSVLKFYGFYSGAVVVFVSLFVTIAAISVRLIKLKTFELVIASIPLVLFWISAITAIIALLNNIAVPVTDKHIPLLKLPRINSQENIYEFVFDTLTNPEYVMATYGSDAFLLLPQLERLGFRRPESVVASKLGTLPSILSVLDARYDVPNQTNRIDFANTRVISNLRESGYKYWHYGEVFAAMNCSADEDRCLSSSVMHLSEFHIALLRRTIIHRVFQRLIINETASANFSANLAGIVAIVPQEKTFVFSYMVPPHPPFIFDELCQTTRAGIADFQSWRQAEIPAFLVAYKCVLGEFIRDVNKIITNDPQAVIIVHGDHGPAFRQAADALGVDWTSHSTLDERPFGDWTPTGRYEREQVLLAVRAPVRCNDAVDKIRSLWETYPALFSCLSEPEQR